MLRSSKTDCSPTSNSFRQHRVRVALDCPSPQNFWPRPNQVVGLSLGKRLFSEAMVKGIQGSGNNAYYNMETLGDRCFFRVRVSELVPLSSL